MRACWFEQNGQVKVIGPSQAKSCANIDECQDWANKAEALASYAKMADDDSLRQMADRIQARAVRRMGELLKQFDAPGKRTDQPDMGGHTKLSQKEVAAQAGISKHQKILQFA